MNRVRKYRKEKGYSQVELANKVGVARQTISMIENDRFNPSLKLCIDLAYALDADLNKLFWCEEEEI